MPNCSARSGSPPWSASAAAPIGTIVTAASNQTVLRLFDEPASKRCPPQSAAIGVRHPYSRSAGTPFMLAATQQSTTTGGSRLRTHNLARRAPITSAPTVGRDLGKRWSAQRFLVVPW